MVKDYDTESTTMTMATTKIKNEKKEELVKRMPQKQKVLIENAHAII